jgi:GNAT superfamily N-acetyltransferase
MMGMRVRPLGADDESWKHDTLVRTWGSTTVARKGAPVDAGQLPGFVADVDGRRAGLVTYQLDDELEIVTIHVDQEGRGVGRALMDAVVSRARLRVHRLSVDPRAVASWLLRSALEGLFGAPWPRLTAAEPASTEETVALDLPPRAYLLQSSGPPQLVDLAQDRLHFLFVTRRDHPVDRAHSTSRQGLLDIKSGTGIMASQPTQARRVRMTAPNDGRHAWEAAPERHCGV